MGSLPGRNAGILCQEACPLPREVRQAGEEKKEHQLALDDKLAEEKKEHQLALDEALLDLQKAFLAEEEEAEPPKEDMSTEALAEWERLTRAPEPSASGLSALMEAAFKGSRELKKAAREKLMAKLANHEDSPAGTPPRRETRAPVLTPPPRETARRPSGPEVENGQVAKEITELITDDEEDSVGDLKPPESPGEPPRREHRIGGTIHRAPDNITSNGLFRCVPVASAQRNPRIVRLEAASSETKDGFFGMSVDSSCISRPGCHLDGEVNDYYKRLGDDAAIFRRFFDILDYVEVLRLLLSA